MPVRAPKPPRPAPEPVVLRLVVGPADPATRERASAILERLLDRARAARKA